MSPLLRHALIATALLASPAFARDVPRSNTTAAVDESFFRVELGGQRVGTLHTRRVEGENRVMTRERMRMTLGRSGTPLVISSDQRQEETTDGKPISFASRTDAAGSVSEWEGRIDEDGSLRIDVRRGNAPRITRMPWPKDALLSEGLRLAQMQRGFKAGTHYRLKAFDMDGLQTMEIETDIGKPVDVDINGRRERLIPVSQVLHFERGKTDSMSWIREDGTLRRSQLSIMGLDLVMTACDQRCDDEAMAGTDVLAATLARAPRPLTLPERHRPLTLLLETEGTAAASIGTLGDIPGQRLRQDAGTARWRLRIDPLGDSGQPPGPDDLRATRWLQSDDPKLLDFARNHSDDQQGAAGIMTALERAVRAHIRNKSLRIGYASASETLHSREGDCTEHALLLAALARASGIPARVATGLVYTDRYGGQRDVFIPHAWVQAWVDGQWRGYDAALDGMDSGHLAIGVGDGDPYRYYQGMSVLGNLKIIAVETAP